MHSASRTHLLKARKSMAALDDTVMKAELRTFAGDYEEGDALGELGGQWEGEQGEADEGVPLGPSNAPSEALDQQPCDLQSKPHQPRLPCCQLTGRFTCLVVCALSQRVGDHARIARVQQL